METPGNITEVAPRVWVVHYDWMHVNITLIGGSDGPVMVDTHGSEKQARIVADDVRRLGAGPLTALVNTHNHWDHWFGNDVILSEYGDLPVHATDFALDRMVESGGVHDAHPAKHSRADEILSTTLRPATHGFSSAVALDLGDRAVELIHPGRGHTAGDPVVSGPRRRRDRRRRPGRGVGQAVHRRRLLPARVAAHAGPRARPDDLLHGRGPRARSGHRSRLRPGPARRAGHHRVETIRDLASRGVPVSRALEQGEWPRDPEQLLSAVRLGYEHLPRAQKRLPLV
ncbi:MBL fold metallo-hydrolase [Nocardioides sp. B-3]|uniref:MBL fold metallo-hydrolase n=1 Tax=Nocardioides sp. B-3 TaxID=2895565 RepID=UPI0021539A24|nr:MBL fold metallo-hydrolase [Nocardioides sp. B-3]UUZ58510.1 MBL fold metallo-hydrolase [Nocardioides sp. B-3]